MRLLSLVALLIAACGGEGTPPGPPPASGTIEALCPTDAIALFQMRNADALKMLGDIRGLPTDPLPRLADLLGFDATKVDRAQPLAVAVSGTGPTLTVIASVSGAYQRFSTVPIAGEGGSALAAGRPDADLFARVDVKQLNLQYRPMIEGLLGMVQGKAGGAGDLIGVVRRLLDVGESFEAVVRMEGSKIALDAHLATAADTVAGVKDLAALVAELPRDFPMVAGGSAEAARLLTGLWGDTAAVGEVAAKLEGGWVFGVDGFRLCLAGRTRVAELETAAAGLKDGLSLHVEGGIVRVLRDADPDDSTPRALEPVTGELALFLRVGEAVATLSADGRLWRLKVRADPAVIRAAIGK